MQNNRSDKARVNLFKTVTIAFVGALLTGTVAAAPPAVVNCPRVVAVPAVPAVPAGTCTVTTGTGTPGTGTPGTGASTAISGTVLAPDKIYNSGIVSFGADGKIDFVGCPQAGQTFKKLVNCSQAVISPGLINTHDHINYNHNTPNPAVWGTTRYDHRAEWRFGLRGKPKIPGPKGTDPLQVAWSELRQVMAGTTSLTGSGGYRGLLRNLDVTTMQEWGKVPKTDSVRYQTFPLGYKQTNVQKANCTGYAYFKGWQTVFTDYQDFLPHVAEGVNLEARNELMCLASQGKGSQALTTNKSTFIHSIAALVPDALIIKNAGASVVWSPRSNISLYGNTAPVTLFDRLGINIALSTDWTPSGSMNMLQELKCAADFSTKHLNNHFTAYELWKMVTINAANALHFSAKVGSLEPGKYADIAVYSQGSDQGYRSIIDANTDTTKLVLRGGAVLFGNADLVHAIRPECEAVAVGGAVAKAACIGQELGVTFTELKSHNTASYALTFGAAVPTGEPTCTPSRPKEYTGTITASDPDGDGIEGASDNCPHVFNPIRPVDNGKQADHNNNEIGDVCDPTPG